MQYLYKNDEIHIEELTSKMATDLISEIKLDHEFSELAALKKMLQVIQKLKRDAENRLIEDAIEHRDLSLLKLRF